jgi:hypothetical protein
MCLAGQRAVLVRTNLPSSPRDPEVQMPAGQSSYLKSGNAALSILPVCASRLLIACQLAFKFLLLDSVPSRRRFTGRLAQPPGPVAGPARPIQPAPASPAGPSWASDRSTLNTTQYQRPFGPPTNQILRYRRYHIHILINRGRHYLLHVRSAPQVILELLTAFQQGCLSWIWP